jgi:ABC-type sugar transport system substrate-binding protein
MRRTLTVLAAAASLALGGAAAAGPAAAASDRSAVKGCPSADHPGKHVGWSDSPGTERRNVGGTCPVG